LKTLHAKYARLPDGWARDVEIRIAADGSVAAVRSAGPAPAGAETVDCLIPGLANVHSHAFQRVMAGWVEYGGGPDSFWSWREQMYACAGRIRAAELNATATHLYIEMLKAGYTSVGEFHYLHHVGERDAGPAASALALMQAAESTGIDLLLLPTLYMHGGFGGQPVEPGQRRFLTTPDEYVALVDELRHHASANVRVGTAFHSLRAVSPEAMTRVLEHRESNDPDGPVHIHAAEQMREIEECVAWSGQRPVTWLLERGCLDRHWCVVHATHMQPDERDGLAATGAVVGLCPTTEANLGDGLFALTDYLAAGGAIAIGSDSHVAVDPREELRWLEYGQRLTQRRRTVAATTAQPHTGGRLFTAALDGGARAIGRPTGRIAAGCRADFVAIDRDQPLFAGASGDGVFDVLVFGGGPNPVTDVMVGGHWVVRDGWHPLEDAAADAFAAVRRRLATTDEHTS